MRGRVRSLPYSVNGAVIARWLIARSQLYTKLYTRTLGSTARQSGLPGALF